MRYGKELLSGIPKTIHGGLAWKTEGIEDYSHNLNPFGPPEDIGEIIQTAVSDIGHYPDDSCTELKGIFSEAFGVGDENIIIGSGSSEIIRNFPNAFLNTGDEAIVNRPSFAEYAQQCAIVGAKVVYNELTEENDYRIDASDLSEHFSKNTKAIYICNPNNPTGRIEPREKILKIVKECSDSGILVFLDETLLELVPDHDRISCAGYVKNYDNLVIAGSLTKSFAIPGIRIGYGIASPSLVGEMDKIRMTWNVGQIEQNVAAILMSERMEHVKKAAKMMAEESKIMHKDLEKIGFPVGNVADSFFYFCSLKELGAKASVFQRHMLDNKIMIRDCASFGKRFEYNVRFSVKDRERNDKFVSAAESALKALR